MTHSAQGSTTSSHASSCWLRSLCTRSHLAFSLVEVTVSIGLSAVSICLLLGLLPVAFQMSHNAKRQAEAGSILKQVATGMHAASKREDGSYCMLGVDSLGTITWTLGDPPLSPVEGYVNASGVPVMEARDADFAYRIEINPPLNSWSTGRAVVRIAWPATASWRSTEWRHSQGSVRSLVIFHPQ